MLVLIKLSKEHSVKFINIAFRRRSFVKKDDTQVKKEPKQVTEKKTKRSAKKEDEAIIRLVYLLN